MIYMMELIVLRSLQTTLTAIENVQLHFVFVDIGGLKTEKNKHLKSTVYSFK